MDAYARESEGLVDAVLAGRVEAATARARALAGLDAGATAAMLVALADHDALAVRRWALDALVTPPLDARLAPVLAERRDGERVADYRRGRALAPGDAAGAAGALLDLARDGLLSQRDAALRALAALRDPACLRLAAALVAANDADLVTSADLALGAFGRAAVPHVAPLLAAGDAVVRERACGILGRCGAPAALLEPMLGDPLPGVRAAAAQALGAVGGTLAVEALGRALGDADGYVRGAAALALAALGRHEFAPAIAALLTMTVHGHDRGCVEALGTLGGEVAQAKLTALVTSYPFFSLRMQAAVALGRAGDERALPALASLLAGLSTFLRLRKHRVEFEREIRWAIGLIRRRTAAGGGA